METLIRESSILGTIMEFEKFCDYIAIQKPVATNRGYLPIKICSDINQQKKRG